MHREKNAKLNSTKHYCHFDFNGKLSHLISSVIHCLVANVLCAPSAVYTDFHIFEFSRVLFIRFRLFSQFSLCVHLFCGTVFDWMKKERPVKTKVTHLIWIWTHQRPVEHVEKKNHRFSECARDDDTVHFQAIFWCHFELLSLSWF